MHKYTYMTTITTMIMAMVMITDTIIMIILHE